MKKQKTSTMISLYDYLGSKSAGPQLGKQVADYAKLVGAKIGVRFVPHSPYADKNINEYEESFLDHFFKVQAIIGTNH